VSVPGQQQVAPGPRGAGTVRQNAIVPSPHLLRRLCLAALPDRLDHRADVCRKAMPLHVECEPKLAGQSLCNLLAQRKVRAPQSGMPA